MACQEHYCPDCGLHEFNNDFWPRCPKCKSELVTNWSDEYEDSDRFDDDEDQIEGEQDEIHENPGN